MKRAIVVTVVAAILIAVILLFGCHPVLGPPRSGSVRCNDDRWCPDWQHCGYEGVGLPLICLDGPPDGPIDMRRRPDAG